MCGENWWRPKASEFGQNCTDNLTHWRNVEECEPGTLKPNTLRMHGHGCISREFRCGEKHREAELLYGGTALSKCPPYLSCSPLKNQELLCFRTRGRGYCNPSVEVVVCCNGHYRLSSRSL